MVAACPSPPRAERDHQQQALDRVEAPVDVVAHEHAQSVRQCCCEARGSSGLDPAVPRIRSPRVSELGILSGSLASPGRLALRPAVGLLRAPSHHDDAIGCVAACRMCTPVGALSKGGRAGRARGASSPPAARGAFPNPP
eukprot:gene3983-biopygen6996